ncbi:MAG: hypothetical protein HRU75_09950 [Planctomycetia bacterium]|nr:MAG: hypothetical protein HRU75_09950 [Planctomycetia bacterium]
MTSNRRSVRCFAPACTLLALLCAAGGCGVSINGQWRMIRANPNRDVFAIDHATFSRDRGYSATITVDGRTAEETGEYEFNGFQVLLRPQAGGQRRYSASVMFGELRITDSQQRSVTLRRK